MDANVKYTRFESRSLNSVKTEGLLLLAEKISDSDNYSFVFCLLQEELKGLML